MAQVAPDYTAWLALFPEFTPVGSGPVTSAQYTAQFALSNLYISNLDSSPVTNLAIRAQIINLVVAHLAYMAYGASNVPGGASPLVGRIESAAEGSVNVKTAYAASSGSRAWWDQTKYGASAWQAMAPWRTARWIQAPRDVVTGRGWG